jgi:hypothetical protein
VMNVPLRNRTKKMENTACTSGRARKLDRSPLLLDPLRDLPERWPPTSHLTAGPDTRTPSTMLRPRRSSTLFQEDLAGHLAH